MKVLELTGQTKGFVTILGRAENKDGRTMWKAFCSRDNVYFETLGKSFNRGVVTSCGCVRTEMNREKARIMSENNKLPPGEAACNLLYASYRWHATTDRGLPFDITKEEFRVLTKKNCFYCGTPPLQEQNVKGLNGNYIYNGIDRVDNELGYTSENGVACCGTCNDMKRTRSSIEFILACRRVTEYQGLAKGESISPAQCSELVSSANG